jgi:stage V sporulation protein SpoVS
VTQAIRVSLGSRPGPTADSIMADLHAEGAASLRSIGSTATTVTLDAILTVRDKMKLQGKDIVFYGSFLDDEMKGRPVVVVRFTVTVEGWVAS